MTTTNYHPVTPLYALIRLMHHNKWLETIWDQIKESCKDDEQVEIWRKKYFNERQKTNRMIDKLHRQIHLELYNSTIEDHSIGYDPNVVGVTL